MIPVLIATSIITFIVIQLPPGDFVSRFVAEQRVRGVRYTPEAEAQLRARYGLDGEVTTQYLRWAKGFLTGDLGDSMYYNKPVSTIIRERLPFTAFMALLAMVFTNAMALPIGLLSAVRQYSVWDYIFMIIGFIGMAIPNFIFALVLMYLAFTITGDANIGGLSQEFIGEPWTMAKVIDLLRHFWIPAIVAGTAGTAGTIRLLRANLLDELEKPYVLVARSKGLGRIRLLFKYPFRMALNPFIVGTAGMLAALLSGELMISVTLGIPTLGPVMLTAVENQDMYLAGSILFIETMLALAGVLMSDILLGIADPRIKDSV